MMIASSDLRRDQLLLLNITATPPSVPTIVTGSDRQDSRRRGSSDRWCHKRWWGPENRLKSMAQAGTNLLRMRMH